MLTEVAWIILRKMHHFCCRISIYQLCCKVALLIFFIPSISMHLKKLVTSFEGFHFFFTPFILPIRFPLCSNLVKGFTITSMNVFIFEILWSNPICVFMVNVMLNLQWNILLVSFHFKDYVQNYVNKSNSSSSSNLLIRNFYAKLFFYQRTVYDNVQRYAVFFLVMGSDKTRTQM